MHKHRYFLAVIMLSCLVPLHAKAVDTIADVKTLADLRAQPVIHLDNGWDVQIGMRDPDADAGPFKLIYCLSKSAKVALKEETTGEYALGPLSVDLVEGQILAQKDKMLSNRQKAADGEKLFCQILPVGGRDDLTIRVSCEDKVLLEKKLGKSEHRAFYWMPFAKRHRDENDVQTVVVSTSQIAQRPYIDGQSSILCAWTKPDTEAPQIPPLDAPLPGGGTLASEWLHFFVPDSKSDDALHLKIENDEFTITAPGRFLETPDEWHLLARWWVNDVPIGAQPETEGKMSGHAAKVGETDTLRVQLGLPAFLGQLKAGDRVSLQVMYVPSFEPIGPGRMGLRMQPITRDTNIPLLTNRLDLTIDKHWLTLVKK